MRYRIGRERDQLAGPDRAGSGVNAFMLSRDSGVNVAQVSKLVADKMSNGSFR
jgi:hypothetical protein